MVAPAARRMATAAFATLFLALGSTRPAGADGAGSPPPPDSLVRGAVARAQELRRQARRDSAYRVVEPYLAPRVRAALPQASRLEVMRIGWTLLTETGRVREGADLSAEGLALARARRDSSAMVSAVYYHGLAKQQLGANLESRADMNELLRLARAFHDSAGIVNALNTLANLDLEAGRPRDARGRYVEARRVAAAARDSARLPAVLANLGVSFSREGQVDSARTWHRRALEVSRAFHNARVEAFALQRLAVLDANYGDPSLAVPRLEEAARTLHRVGSHREALFADLDRGELLLVLGRRDEAAAVADSARQVAAGMGQASVEAEAGNLLGRVALAADRPARAAAEYRRVLGMPGADADAVAHAAGGAVRALCALDSVEAAAAVLQAAAPRVRGHLPRLDEIQLDVLAADVERRRGHLDRALAESQRLDGEATRLGEPLPLLEVLLLRARCERARGDDASAGASLERGLRTWESRRAKATDPYWRERLTALARDLVSERMALELGGAGDPAPGIERALAAVERYKARTLGERVREPGPWPAATAPAPFSVADWRRRALGADDLFLECFAATDTTWIFAVTRDDIRLAGAPPLGGDLGRRIVRLQAAAGRRPDPGEDGAALGSVANALVAEIFGPLRPLLESHRRWLIAPDDQLALMPFALAGAGAGHEAAIVPSAAFLTTLRARARPAPGSAGPIVLAFAGPGLDDRRPLPGARNEVAMLRRTYPGTRAIEGATELASLALAGSDALHFAAHAVASDQAPWSSGILLAPAEGSGEPRYLRAAAIATMRTHARLAVLSGCETAGGAAVSGEGVLGLAEAFLSSGVQTVVASLWRVDDRVSAGLMESFYAALARGEPAVTALREAQERVRRDPATSHPYYWAGFRVIGDPLGSLPAPRARGRAAGPP